MFNVSTIKTEFANLVGYQNSLEVPAQITGGLINPTSGIYMDDVHPYITLENIYAAAPNKSTGFNFTTWITQKHEGAIVQALTAWFTKKVSKGTARNLLSKSQLFKVSGDRTDLDAASTKLRGREFVLTKSYGVKVQMLEIGLQLSQNQTLDLYLFDSEGTTPLTMEVNYNKNGGVQWFPTTWVLDTQKTYWVVYDAATLTGQSINGREIQNGRYPMGSYFSTRAFEVVGTTASLWDVTDNVGTTSTNYGLNFRMSATCDYTDLLVEQKTQFATFISKSIGIYWLKFLATNPHANINNHEANIEYNRAMAQIVGDTQATKGNEYGLGAEYKQAFEAISLDMGGISKVCLPCKRGKLKFVAT